MTEKILVLGASCDLGRRLSLRFAPERIIGTYCSSPFEGGIYFDALTMDLDEIVNQYDNVSHAVILIAESNPNICAENIIASRSLNIDAIQKILTQLQKWNVHPIFTSTEVVFDGADAPYTECDDTNPILIYGKQKLEIEKFMEDLFTDYTVYRISRMYGDKIDDGTLFMEWLQSFQKGEKIKCAKDQCFSPVFIEDVVEALVAAINKTLSGVFHVGGPRSMSRIEMLHCLTAGIESQHHLETTIEVCSINDFELLEKRPFDVSLISDQIIKEIGVTFKDVEEMCAKFAMENYGRDDAKINAQLKSDRRVRLGRICH